MKLVEKTIRKEREKIVDTILLFYGIFIILPVASSLSRISMLGLNPPFIIQLITVIGGWLIYLNRNRVIFELKAWWILMIFLTAGFTGVIEFGVIGNGMTWMILGPSFAAILFGKRLGLILGGAGFFGLLLAGTLIVNSGYVPFQSTVPYAVSFSSWFDFIFSFFFVSTVLVVATSQLNNRLVEALKEIRQQSIALEEALAARTTELEEANEKLSLLSHRDDLADHMDRMAFIKAGELEIDNCRRQKSDLTFLIIDIDDFSEINNQYGVVGGSVAIKALSRLIKGSIREGDLAGRIGGDVFGVILTDLSLHEGSRVAEDLRKSAEGILLKHHDGSVSGMTVSIGASAYSGESLKALIKVADTKLYEAKRLGKNRVVI